MTSLFKTKSTQSSTSRNTFEKQPKGTVKIGGVNALSAKSGVVGVTGGGLMRRTGLNSEARNRTQRNRLTRDVNDLRSNMNPYINARVRPLEERLDTTLADQEREFGRRNVFGSLANNELNKTRFLGEREIGDARAMATNEALSQILQTEGALTGLTKDDMGIAESRVRDELARMGIGGEFLLGLMGQRRQTSGTETVSGGSKPGIGAIIGAGLSLYDGWGK